MAATESDSRNGTVPTRADLLKKLSALIAHCETRCTTGRVKDAGIERIRQGWATVTVNGIKAYLAGLKDQELDDIDTRLTALGQPARSGNMNPKSIEARLAVLESAQHNDVQRIIYVPCGLTGAQSDEIDRLCEEIDGQGILYAQINDDGTITVS